MDLFKTKEKEFRRYVTEYLWDQIDPSCPLRRPGLAEVRLGALIPDLVAINAEGGLSIVEFKVKATNDVLAQLLLHPRAVREALKRSGCSEPPALRMVLVTSFLDVGVVEVMAELNPKVPTIFRICITTDAGHDLVDPRDPRVTGEQFWDKTTIGRSQIAWDAGVFVRNERLDGGSLRSQQASGGVAAEGPAALAAIIKKGIPHAD